MTKKEFVMCHIAEVYSSKDNPGVVLGVIRRGLKIGRVSFNEDLDWRYQTLTAWESGRIKNYGIRNVIEYLNTLYEVAMDRWDNLTDNIVLVEKQDWIEDKIKDWKEVDVSGSTNLHRLRKMVNATCLEIANKMGVTDASYFNIESLTSNATDKRISKTLLAIYDIGIEYRKLLANYLLGKNRRD